MDINRRRILIGLSCVSPASWLLIGNPALAHLAKPSEQAADPLLRVSRILVGRDDLSPVVSQRIGQLLMTRIPQFGTQLDSLDRHLAGGLREQQLASLNEPQLQFALTLVKPWYLGVVGTPSGSSFKDDAHFVTFLQAHAYEVVKDELPRPSYPPAGPGWWQATPQGVTAPPMPEAIVRWDFQLPAASGRITPPDPAWRAYAIGSSDVRPGSTAGQNARAATSTTLPMDHDHV